MKQELPVTIYTNDSDLKNPKKLFKEMFQDLFKSHGLAFQLAVRDIKAQYRQTALGIMWAFFIPLANTITWIFIQKSGVVSIQSTSIPYPVYVFTGTVLWAILMESVTAPLQQTNKSKQMLSKLNFPRESLFLSGIYKVLFNGTIKLALLFPALFYFSVYPDIKVLLLPLAIFALILFGTAVGLLITPVGILFQDIGRALPFAMQFLMYFAPVVFPMPSEGFAKMLFNLNPVTYLIVTTRDIITAEEITLLSGYMTVVTFSGLLFFFSWMIYKISMPILIERMNA